METKALTRKSSENELKQYFMTVLELSNSNEEYPVDLDEVWPIVYSEKGKAVRALKENFIENIDYQCFAKNGKTEFGGFKTIVYKLSVPCLEYFIVRKVRPVFEVYRRVFHKVANIPSYQIDDRIERAKAWIKEEEERVALAQQNTQLQLENKSLTTSNKHLQEKADNLQDLTNYYKDKARLSEERTTKWNIECIMLTKDCKERDQVIDKLNGKIEQDKEKVNYYDQCNENADKTLMSFRETASLLNVKERTLLDVLYFFDWIYGTKRGPRAKAKYLDKGYFQNVEGVADNGYQFCQTKTTIEGRRYLNDNWERMLMQYRDYRECKNAAKNTKKNG